jgi:tetratricopeptide (TPR) repeat protein
MRIKRWMMMAMVVGMASTAWSLKIQFDIDAILRERPSKKSLVEDYSGPLREMRDYADQHLLSIRKRYGIEAMVVVIPTCGKERTVQETALTMMENWRIGARHGGRGLLLLLVHDTKQVKLEVAMELEDVFTDAFSGYVEDKQLKNYYLSNDVGTGLIAVMEEIEKRAQLKAQSRFDERMVRRLDDAFLSQGAGAQRSLDGYQPEPVQTIGAQYPAATTPEEAWQTLIKIYRDKVRDPNAGVYTDITKLAYADYQNLPDSYYVEEYQKYVDKPYEILQAGDYAVVFFSKEDGWGNAPFLLSRTPAGWQFDVAHQRKYVRMGRAPKWGIERGDYPHIGLLSRCPYFEGQDIPLSEQDRYHVHDDARYAQQIKKLLGQVRSRPDDAESLLQLGRLATITSYSRQRIQWLNRAKQLNPVDPRSYKYLAISHVDMFYQYKKAIKEIREYVRRVPQDTFGHNYLGYLLFVERDYAGAARSFEKVLDLDPANFYAVCKLARANARLYSTAMAMDPRRFFYKENAMALFRQAQALQPESRRLNWVKRALRKDGVFGNKEK